jgi:hypothetical protein
MGRSRLKTKSLGNDFWDKPVHTTIYTLNICTTRVVLNSTPKEAWSRYKPSVSHMKVFCYTTYAHVPKEKRRNLDVKVLSAFLLDIVMKQEVTSYLILKQRK